MPDWDVDSERLSANLKTLVDRLSARAADRAPLTLDHARSWHAQIMDGLDVPNPDFVGRFRGESRLEHVGVRIGRYEGTHPNDVADELDAFITHLTNAIEYLDKQIPVGEIPTEDTLSAVIDVCAWAHAEWVRIHPFANGNGRSARLWANVIATRYGLPPFVRLRPRPEGTRYAITGSLAMQGNWQPTATVFRKLLDDFLNKRTNIQ